VAVLVASVDRLIPLPATKMRGVFLFVIPATFEASGDMQSGASAHVIV
jgi:hypothetical protein